MAQTEKGIIYPYNYNEVADVPADFKALAESIDRILSDYSLSTDSGNKIVLEMNSTTYKIKAVLKDKDDNVISTSNEIDLPFENMVTNISYNDQTLILTHQDGQTTEVSIADLISDLASKEDVSELQSQVDDLTTLVETELESNEVEGTEIDVSDSAEYRGRIEVKGNTYQKQLSGKNFYGINDYEGTFKNVTIKIKDGEMTLNGTANGTGTLYIEPKNEQIFDGTYTIVKNLISGTQTGSGNINLRNANDDTVIDGTQLSLGDNIRTFTINNTSIKYGIYLMNGVTFNNFKIRPQIVVGNTPDYDFEPYCGGQASPNPDYPQDIKVVTGDNVIKHVGKNLLKYPYNETTVTKSGVTFTDKGDGTVLVNGSNSSRASAYYNMQLKSTGSSGIILNPGTYTFDLGIASNVRATISEYDNSNNVIASIRTNQRLMTFIVTEKIKVNAVLAVNANSSVNNVLIKPQIIEGSTAAPYEPYREEEYELNLGTMGLCKIDDYQDILFKNEVGDENYNAELEEGAWYKKKAFDKKVLDDLWEWFMPTTNRFHVNITLPDGEYDLVALCDKFINALYWPTHINTDKSFIVHNGNWENNLCRISFVDKNCASLAEWTQFVSKNNLIVYHRLLNPTYEKITDPTLISQLEALRKAKWFKGVNHWWTETENLEPNLKGTYKQSNNLRLQALEQAVVALGGV